MAKIEVKVTDKSENGISGAEVTVKHGDTPEINVPEAEEVGVYKCDNIELSEGTYTVKVKAPEGYQDPASLEVEVAAGGDLEETFALAEALQTGAISGSVTDEKCEKVPDARVKAIDQQNQEKGEATTDQKGNYIIRKLPENTYTVKVVEPLPLEGYYYLEANKVKVTAGHTKQGINFSLDVVKHFLEILDDERFSIETPISDKEANQAVNLFYVVNIMLAGLGRRSGGTEEKTDILGILSLYYGLQDKSLVTKLPVSDSERLWRTIETDLKNLATGLDQLQSDVDFLTQEAKRQFNLGTNNSVPGNAKFPTLFKRYIEIGLDPLLSINIREVTPEKNPFFDKEKLAKAYDLLKELKGLLLQIVRSLSKFGTAATKRVNEDWSSFEARALEVLVTVAQERVSDDVDEKNPWAVLAVLTEKNRETEIAPYVVLGRHGGKLLEYAMKIYKKTKDKLDQFDDKHLLDLFQPQNEEYLTDLIRKEAAFIKRYPLENWE